MDEKQDTPQVKKVTSNKAIGQMIRARRKKLGYTQEYVSEFTGLSPRLIGEIERGKETTGIQKVINLAMILGMDFELRERG
jgi:transcriptional regulator with XRE-family HTH domain